MPSLKVPLQTRLTRAFHHACLLQSSNSCNLPQAAFQHHQSSILHEETIILTSMHPLLDQVLDADVEVRNRAEILSTTISAAQQKLEYSLLQPVVEANVSIAPRNASNAVN